MMQLPPGTHLEMAGLGEAIMPSIESTQMERGPAKLRKTNSQVMCAFKATLYFETSAAADAFIDWYLGPLDCIGYFQVRNPRNGQLLTVRFENGAVGELNPVDDSAYDSRRAVVMEYLR